MDERYIYIYGKHAVLEALRMRPDVVCELYVREDTRSELPATPVKVAFFKGDAIPKAVDRHAVHQGYIAKIDTHALVVDFDDFVRDLPVTPHSALTLLGELHDPHNVGAVIRSAAAFGLGGVLIPQHRQVGVTGTVVKVSAGMAFVVPLVSVGNVNRAIEKLKEKGFFVYGLEGAGSVPLHTEQFTKPSVFVLGNEGEGIREKTKEHCDLLLSIATHPQCESLNASASAATVFYAWSTQHQSALG
jgi:23S rRNA (guanosine2251-2'-O)-methyltransferase